MKGWTWALLGIVIAGTAQADFSMKRNHRASYRNMGGGISMDMNSIQSRGLERWANVNGEGVDYLVHMNCQTREFRLLGYNEGWVETEIATAQRVMVETACKRR